VRKDTVDIYMGEYIRVDMLDSWGDGWGDSRHQNYRWQWKKLERAPSSPAVNIFEGGLGTGRDGYSYLYLEPFQMLQSALMGSLWGGDPRSGNPSLHLGTPGEH
jgi:hypothetical protein